MPSHAGFPVQGTGLIAAAVAIPVVLRIVGMARKENSAVESRKQKVGAI